jgi:hypothetical protein
VRSGLDDYIDADVSYLLGLIMARGTIINSQEGHNIRQLTIEFPKSSLEVKGINLTFDQDTSIKLGLLNIRERLTELLDTDITIHAKTNSIDLIIRFMHNSLVWRDILLLTNQAISYRHFQIPKIFFDPDLPTDWKKEFVKGFADVAGNIRPANRFTDGRHRVRLDILNYQTNWEMPVQLCALLQEQLDIPVQLITWGHPNMNRDFREHQINIFAKPFLQIGFSFIHKQKILEELAKWNADKKEPEYKPCKGPYLRKVRKLKNLSTEEHNQDRLDKRLIGNHYNSYWQICEALGCKQRHLVINSSTSDEEDETTDENGGS